MVFAKLPKHANMKQIRSIFAKIRFEANKKKLQTRRTLQVNHLVLAQIQNSMITLYSFFLYI